MTEPLAYLNGHLLPQSQARLALSDAGFVFGATVTDLCRTFQHRLYRWDDHLARFRRSCRAAYLDVPGLTDWDEVPSLTPDPSPGGRGEKCGLTAGPSPSGRGKCAITSIAEKLTEHNAKLIGADDDLALVLFATPGPVGFYLGEPMKAGEQPTFGMHTFPLPFARYRPWIEQGVALRTPSVRALPAACIDPHIKQRSRMHWWLAEQEVRRVQPDAQALLLDEAGHVTETASANFLIVKDDTIISPLAESVLDGVSLRVVGELCAALGMRMEYRQIDLADCYAADEALVTCTSYCIAGVRSINERTLPWPGPVLARLVDAWSIAVGVGIHEQIRGSGMGTAERS